MTLLRSIQKNEGFRGNPYNDHLGNPTIGYGTLLPITEKEAELLLQHRLSLMTMELHANKPEVLKLPQDKQDILNEMAYQMGVPNLMRFEKMWKALEVGNYDKASFEMLNSKWAKQTSTRAFELAEKMKG
jgi:lysozyme